MKKKTLEIYKYKNLGRNYAHIGEMPGFPDIMNIVLEFANNKKVHIYKHSVYQQWVENVKYKPLIVDDAKIPCGDEIWYLDIYYQDK